MTGPAYDVSATPPNTTKRLHRFVPLACCLGGGARVMINPAAGGAIETEGSESKLRAENGMANATELDVDETYTTESELAG